VREGGHYLLVTNGVVGTKGIGNHKHNDQLAFEYHVAGRPLLVDPGSLAYTGDPSTRNLFRSTASHNTVRIDGVEQNELKPELLFRLFESSHPEHLRFERTEAHVEYQGRHVGYRRLEAPVTHERTLRFLRGSGALLIADLLAGHGDHVLTWHFHAAPGVKFRRAAPRLFHLEDGGARFCLWLPDALTGDPVEAACSPSYGVRVPSQALDLSVRTSLREEALFFFALGSEEWFDGTGRDALQAMQASMLRPTSAPGRVSP
jgi:hypothetical protein